MINKNFIVKYYFILFFLVQFFNINSLFSQIKVRIQLVEKESKLTIPFAYIKVPSKNIVLNSDQDGFFSTELSKNDTIEITHVAYKSLRIAYSDIGKNATIELDELPVLLNPIIISSKNAEITVKRAIGATYESMQTPMNFSCFRKDQITINDTLVTEADAEIIYKLKKLNSASHGGNLKSYLINVHVYKNSLFNKLMIPNYFLGAIFAPINTFIAGFSKNDDQLLNFSYQEGNDSLIIVGAKPKKNIRPKNGELIKQGNFVINKNTGKLIQIVTSLSPEMMEWGRNNSSREKNPNLFYYHYTFSQYFDQEGFPSRVSCSIKFSIKEDNPNKIWSNNSELIFTKLSQDDLILDKSHELNNDSTLVQMKSRFDPDFEKRFTRYIPSTGTDNNQ